MEKLKIYFWVILSASFLGCNKENSPDCLQRSGDTVEVSKSFPLDIQKIILYDNIQLTLTNSTNEENFMTITGGENLIPEIDFEFNGNELTIRNLNSCNWVRPYGNFQIELHTNQVNHIFNWGSGGVIVEDYLSSSLILEQEASLADNHITFLGDSLLINMHSGAGSSVVKGNASYASFYTNGLCTIQASEMTVTDLIANNSGENHMYVYSTLSLFAYIAGSGNIYYQESDATLSSNIQGTGHLFMTEM